MATTVTLSDGSKMTKTPTHDPVNHPSHYTQGGIECIDAMKAALSHEEFIGFLRGQVFKYGWRAGLKDPVLQDLAKLQWYLNRLIKELEEEHLELTRER